MYQSPEHLGGQGSFGDGSVEILERRCLERGPERWSTFSEAQRFMSQSIFLVGRISKQKLLMGVSKFDPERGRVGGALSPHPPFDKDE